jgi:hypothetical protein
MRMGLVTSSIISSTIGCKAPESHFMIPPPSEQVRDSLGRLGVRSRADLVEVEILPSSGGTLTAMGQEGRAAFEGAFELTARGAANKGGVVAIVPILLSPLFFVGGAIHGLFARPSSENVDRARGELRRIAGRPEWGSELGNHLISRIRGQTAHPVEPLRNLSRVDTLLDATVVSVGLAGPFASEPTHQATMTVRVRLVRLGEMTVLYEQLYYFHGTERTLDEWASAGASAFEEEIRRSILRLADHIVEECFLLHLPAEMLEDRPALPVNRPHEAAPPPAGHLASGPPLRPTFQWPSADPGLAGSRLTAAPGKPRYDFRLWRVVDGIPRDLVASVDGLSEPRYPLSSDLDPASQYAWTQRARFQLDGKTRVSEWSGQPGWSRSATVPNRTYARYSTP